MFKMDPVAVLKGERFEVAVRLAAQEIVAKDLEEQAAQIRNKRR